VSVAVNAAAFGTEEARSVISSVIKSVAMFLLQLAHWVQSLLTKLWNYMSSNPLAMIMLLTNVGILLT